ncbi:hypothetical protein JL49_19540 [Pseudoalteromonas luteoviolacea]|nr:hypothetical protein JL49_19540 [Pseudoalteromonas luteoviolacea]
MNSRYKANNGFLLKLIFCSVLSIFGTNLLNLETVYWIFLIWKLIYLLFYLRFKLSATLTFSLNVNVIVNGLQQEDLYE